MARLRPRSLVPVTTSVAATGAFIPTFLVLLLWCVLMAAVAGALVFCISVNRDLRHEILVARSQIAGHHSP